MNIVRRGTELGRMLPGCEHNEHRPHCEAGYLLPHSPGATCEGPECDGKGPHFEPLDEGELDRILKDYQPD